MLQSVTLESEGIMFYTLLQFDKELANILKEKHLELGFIIRIALLELQLRDISIWETNQKQSSYFERVHLTETDFFYLYRKSQEIEVDPNMLLSYAFTETLLDILRL